MLTSTPGAGELFPQPGVRTGGRPPARLDDVVPPGPMIAVHGLVSSRLRESAAECGVPLLQFDRDRVTTPTSGFECGPEAMQWFARHAVDYVIVRPDHYAYATSSSVAGAVDALHGYHACTGSSVSR